MMSKTRTKTEEARARAELTRATKLLDREGLANLSAAATTAKCPDIFIDMDFALGLMMHAADLSSAKKQKLIEAGRAKRLSLLPPIIIDQGTVDLVVRLPAGLDDLPQIAQQLLALGLRPNSRRAASAFAEFLGSSDVNAVRIVVEAIGGTVTTIASPSHGTDNSSEPDRRRATADVPSADMPSADVSEADPEISDHENTVSGTELAIRIDESDWETQDHAVAPDNNNFSGPNHINHGLRPEYDAMRASIE